MISVINELLSKVKKDVWAKLNKRPKSTFDENITKEWKNIKITIMGKCNFPSIQVLTEIQPQIKL